MLRSQCEADWHASDEQLVALNDAELGGRERTRVRRHADRCWRCRTRLREIEEIVSALMTVYAASLDDDGDEEDADLRTRGLAVRGPAAARPRLPREALDALHAAAGRRTASARGLRTAAWEACRRLLAGRARDAGWTIGFPLTARVGAVCATALIVVLLSGSPPLSARQLVRQVDRAERAEFEGARAPVVYQRLEVATRRLPARTVTGEGTWEIWTEVAAGRHRSRPVGAGAPASSLDALLAVFERHRMTGGWPVSLRSHQRWRERGEAVDDVVHQAVTPAGEAVVTLESTAIRGDRAYGVVQAALTVRERDWHPVEQRLVVRDGQSTTEFVVREMDFKVMPLSSLPVAFFDERPGPPAPAPAPVAGEARRRLAPSASDLVTAEVQAMYALHRFGVTAEDEITVERGKHGVQVRGLTTTEERRQRLVRALANIPLVRARIRTAEEALVSMTAPRGVAATRPSSAAPAPGGARPTSTTSATPSGAAPPGAMPDGAVPVPLRFDETRIEADRLPMQALAGLAPPRGAASGGPAGAPASDGRADEAAMRRARDAVRQSLALLERAWALRRLAEWLRRTHSLPTTPGTHDLIEVMAREHAEAASAVLAALDSTVTPVLPALAARQPASAPDGRSRNRVPPDGPVATSAAPAPPEAGASASPAADRARPWAELATDFFGIAAEIDRDTRRLFTASTTPAAAVDAAKDAQRLRRGLDRAARGLEALQQARLWLP
ncbi:MAG: hypothetical protein GEU99_26330 [Luteitalea sp.]|nr:hypothetical protein [Luteitalea sp.]